MAFYPQQQEVNFQLIVFRFFVCIFFISPVPFISPKIDYFPWHEMDNSVPIAFQGAKEVSTHSCLSQSIITESETQYSLQKGCIDPFSSVKKKERKSIITQWDTTLYPNNNPSPLSHWSPSSGIPSLSKKSDITANKLCIETH